MNDFVEEELGMSNDAYTHHFPTIGIYGRLAGVNILTSLHAAFWDMNWNVIYIGDSTEEHNIDFAVHLDVNILIKNAKDGSESIIDLQGAEVYGSGTGKVTSTIKNAMKTGQVILFGLPEDEVALIEQEDLAQTVAMVLFEHIHSGPQGTVPAWGVRSKVVKLGEVAKVIFRKVNEYFDYLGSTQQAQYAPYLNYPVISERLDRGNTTRAAIFAKASKQVKPEEIEEVDAIKHDRKMEETPAIYFNGYTDLNHGVKTTIYRLASEGNKFEQSKAQRYALPREILFEMTHDKQFYDPNAYLLDS